MNTILIVDDTEENIDILVDLLFEEYNLLVALDGQKALELARVNTPDLILLDVMMPGINGYEVCRRLKEDDETKFIPIVFLTALSEDSDEAVGIRMGAIDYIRKPFNPVIVSSRIKNYIKVRNYQNKLEVMVKERTQKIEKTKDVIIKSMGVLAEYRDPETGGHIHRTQNYVFAMAEYLMRHGDYPELTEDIIEYLFKSAPLHDLGKIAVPDHILLKPGKLTEEEFEIMKTHTLYGKNAVAAIEEDLPGEMFIKYAKEIAYCHHEKWDGTGYPRGLKGNDIPLSGRIMAIADVYDALISERIYKPAFSHEKAKSIIFEGKGKHFDPALVEAFDAIEDVFVDISKKYKD